MAAAASAALTGAAATASAAGGSLVTLVDNSEADSWLEIDRTANVQTGHGDAGSDHDGSAVEIMKALLGQPDEDED